MTSDQQDSKRFTGPHPIPPEGSDVAAEEETILEPRQEYARSGPNQEFGPDLPDAHQDMPRQHEHLAIHRLNGGE